MRKEDIEKNRETRRKRRMEGKAKDKGKASFGAGDARVKGLDHISQLSSKERYNIKRNLAKRLEKTDDPTVIRYQCMTFDLHKSIRSSTKGRPKETFTGNSSFELQNEKELQLLKGDVVIIMDKYGIPCVIKTTGQKTKGLAQSIEYAMREYSATRTLFSDKVRHGKQGVREQPSPISSEPSSPLSAVPGSTILDCIVLRVGEEYDHTGKQHPLSLIEAASPLSSALDPPILDCIIVRPGKEYGHIRERSPSMSPEPFPVLSHLSSSLPSATDLPITDGTIQQFGGNRYVNVENYDEQCDGDSAEGIVGGGQVDCASRSHPGGSGEGGGSVHVHRAFASRMRSKKDIELGPSPVVTYTTKKAMKALRAFSAKVAPLTQLVEILFKTFLPKDYEKYERVFRYSFPEPMGPIDRAFGVWTSRSLIMNAGTNIYNDLEDVFQGWSAISPFGDFRGGHAYFPQLGVKVEANDQFYLYDLILFLIILDVTRVSV